MEVVFPGLPCRDRGNWEQESLRDRSQACFAKSSAIQSFSGKGLVHEFYRLNVLIITLEQVNTSVVGKKNNLNQQNFYGQCCKFSLYAIESRDEHAVYFR